MGIKPYLNTLLLVSFINGPLNIIGTALGFREITTYFTLYAILIIDIFLILVNFKNLKFKKIEQILILFLLFSFCYGLFNNANGGRRYFTDTLIPLILLLKTIVFRSFITNTYSQAKIIRFLLTYSKYLFVSAVVTAGLFYILLPYYPMYVGLTPILYPFLCINIIFFNPFNLLYAIILILLSGKRAILIGTLIIFIFHKIIFEKKLLKTIIVSSLLVFSCSWIIKNNFDLLMKQEAFSKYNWTVELVKSEDFELNNTELLDLISGGRMAEIEGSLRGIKWYEYLIGRGSGFTYDLFSNSYGYVKNHSNAHFTPIGIVTKYGALFYILFMTYIIGTIIHARKGWKKDNNYYLIISLMTIGTIVDSCFAYVFFIDNFLPIGLGFLQANPFQNKSSI